MKALVYHGPSQRGWDTVADLTIIDPTDIVAIDLVDGRLGSAKRFGRRHDDQQRARER